MSPTPPAPKATDGAIAACIVLGIVIGLIWVLQLATVASLGHSDAAGNGIGEAYAAIQIIVLWLLLTIMTVIASVKGAAPKPVVVTALVIVPGSGIVAMSAADLLARAHLSPFLWPIIIPALIPPLVVAWCFLALSASMLRATVVRIAAGTLLGATPAVCVSIWPLTLMRNAVDDLEAARLQKYDADLARVPANAPLWDWTPFLDTQDSTKRAKVLDSIRGIGQRQAQAEVMLDRGDFPVGYLGSFDLDPTPALCEKARSLLRRLVEPLVRKTPDPKPYSDIALPLTDAISGMDWLVGYGCACNAESAAWEVMAREYSNTSLDVHHLAELRDPRELRRTLRERRALFNVEREVAFEGVAEICRRQQLAGASAGRRPQTGPPHRRCGRNIARQI